MAAGATGSERFGRRLANMEIFYMGLFGLMAVAAAVLELGKPKEASESNLTRDFLRFSRYPNLSVSFCMSILCNSALYEASNSLDYPKLYPPAVVTN